MKKAKNDAAKSKMSPDQSATQGTTTQQPHEEYAKKDASFKKSRGSQS